MDFVHLVTPPPLAAFVKIPFSCIICQARPHHLTSLVLNGVERTHRTICYRQCPVNRIDQLSRSKTSRMGAMMIEAIGRWSGSEWINEMLDMCCRARTAAKKWRKKARSSTSSS